MVGNAGWTPYTKTNSEAFGTFGALHNALIHKNDTGKTGKFEQEHHNCIDLGCYEW